MQFTRQRVCPGVGCRSNIKEGMELSLRRFGSNYRCSFCQTEWRGATIRANNIVLLVGFALLTLFTMMGSIDETGYLVGLIVFSLLYVLGSRMVLVRLNMGGEAKGSFQHAS